MAQPITDALEILRQRYGPLTDDDRAEAVLKDPIYAQLSVDRRKGLRRFADLVKDWPIDRVQRVMRKVAELESEMEHAEG